MFEKISRYSMYAALCTPLLLVRPLFFPFIAGKAISFRIIVEIAALFFLLHLLTRLHHKQYVAHIGRQLKNPIVLCIAALAIAVTITALLGVNPTQSFWSNFERGEGAFQMLHYAVFFALIVLLFHKREQFEKFLLFHIMVSVPMCLYALLQLLTPIETAGPFVVAPGDRVSGTLGNPSYLAAYLIFTLAFILYFLIVRREQIKQFIYLLLAVPAASGLFLYLLARDWQVAAANVALDHAFIQGTVWYIGTAVVLSILWFINARTFQTVALGILFIFELFILLKTGTRGAFLALFAGILIIAIINFIYTHNRRVRIALGAIFAGGLILAGLFFATPQATIWHHLPIFGRLINLSSAMNDIKPRVWTWHSALSGFTDHPVLGWGAENFPNAFDKYYNPNHYGIESFFDRTHNIFLEYAITGGLAVLIPWLAIFFFYYRALRKQRKDVWYSILFVLPIMYFVQGFFLFDTLPIYLGLFLLLLLMINLERGEPAAEHADVPGELRGFNIATAAILVAGCGALLYSTALLPLRKNLLLVDTLKKQQEFGAGVATVTIPSIFAQFDRALNFYSPIGQEETIGMQQKFVLSVIENVSQNPDALNNPQAKTEVHQIVAEANRWYDSNLGKYPGLKAAYVNGGINLRAGISFNLPDLLARGKKQFAEALAIAPTRIEFIRVLIDLAQLENDTTTYEFWLRRAHQYRPDMFPLTNTPS